MTALDGPTKQQAAMAQPVGDRVQLAGSCPATIPHGNLFNAKSRTVRHQQHFGGVLHPSGRTPKLDESIAFEGTKSGLAVAKPAPSRQREQKIEPRYADMAMQPRHSSNLEPIARPGSHDDVRSLHDSLHELSKLAKVVATVGIREDDHVAVGGLEASPDRHAVPPPRFPDDGRAEGGGHNRATIRGTVVDDDDLTAESGGAKPLQRLLDRSYHAFRLIETRQYDRDAHGRKRDR